MCARFLSHLLLLYIERVHGAISGCTVSWAVHSASAQNKTLVSALHMYTLSLSDICCLCCSFLIMSTLLNAT